MGSSTGSGPRRRRERGSAEGPGWSEPVAGWADASDRSPYDPRSRASDVPGEDTDPLDALKQDTPYHRPYVSQGAEAADGAVASGDGTYGGAGWENAYLTRRIEDGADAHQGATPATGDLLAGGYGDTASAAPDHVDPYGGHETRHLTDPGYAGPDYGPSTGEMAAVGYGPGTGGSAGDYGGNETQRLADADYGPSTGMIAPVTFARDGDGPERAGGHETLRLPGEHGDADYGPSTGMIAPVAYDRDADGPANRTQLIGTGAPVGPAGGDAEAGARRTGEEGPERRGFLGSGWRGGPEPDEEEEPRGRRRGGLIAAAVAVVLVAVAGFWFLGGDDTPDCAAGDVRCVSKANSSTPSAAPSGTAESDEPAEDDEPAAGEEDPGAEETAEPTPTATTPPATAGPRTPARPSATPRENRTARTKPSESSVSEDLPTDEPSTSSTEEEESLTGDGTNDRSRSTSEPTRPRVEPSPPEQPIEEEPPQDEDRGGGGWFDWLRPR